ncbi:MAG TPA: kynureninase [Candidatus Sulfotelmatobacter sp.]|nr:kynureninase [Candidatus Sulfotelmatobacter sp.]
MTFHVFEASEEFAREMDRQDPLAGYRERFWIPKTPTGEDCIYLCGHSLGLQPKSATQYVCGELEDWAKLGVEGHFHARNPWIPYHHLLAEQTATLVGAKTDEVVVMNSLTVNLHLMMVSFYRPTKRRHKILIERGAFPSDEYAVKSQIQFHGFDPATSLLEAGPRAGEFCLRNEDIQDLITREGDSIALVLFSGVSYVTGQAFDLPGITAVARQHGCTVGLDLAHAAGNLPLRLHEWGPDFAVWCSYKYLNGGPGCVGGCFVHERHARSTDLPRFAGWWGHNETVRFKMEPEFDPIAGAEGWQVSNPPILALAALRASMDIFHEAGMQRLREKSLHLTAYMEFLLRTHASERFSVITPSAPESRGAQLSIRLPRNGRKFCAALAAEGVIGDWREPDVFRVAPVPLYNSYSDVYRFVQRFIKALT